MICIRITKVFGPVKYLTGLAFAVYREALYKGEAVAVVELWAPGFVSVFYEVDISWADPIVSLEFN